jgi:photosystem II stability/assembly factor-like uncharacterized protein
MIEAWKAPRGAVLLLMIAATAAAPAASAKPAQAPTVQPQPHGELRWRAIGPFRGGRTKAAAGVPSRPGVFFIGVCNGGVWKTTDYGRTWAPIFDDQPTGSIGALAVAASNPDVIYVGSGEGLQRPDLSTGDGMYRSLDGGKRWQHLGLRDGQQIPQIIVDPQDPKRLFVAVLGHPYGPNSERGIFRSQNGGETFERVLYRDENTGGVDLAFDPQNSRTIYAVLWESRLGPWENSYFSGPGSGVYKSTDGGTSWRQLTKGLPTFDGDGLGRIGLTVAPSDPRRLYATVEAKRNGGLYRSDDAGESWRRINSDDRVVERGSDFAEVKVHPQNPDIVFTGSVVVWKSTNGGQSFTALRGAPGGDDYHRIWIDPQRPDVMLVASDQGAIITVNGGASWSSWYNQPTAQMFHVTADAAFPYRLCGGQQESGSACVASRSDEGRLGPRSWTPVGVEEYGYAAPDPLNPDVVYGGKVSRWDRRTGQTQAVGPMPLRGPDYRVVRTQPIAFSPVDPRTLFFASNRVWKTRDGGKTWTSISPDLTRKTWEVPSSVGKYRGSPAAKVTQRGVVYALSPSPIEVRTLWAGTDDGLIHLTRDGGKTWTDVTPPLATPWAKVSILDAGHRDVHTAYAAINTFRLDDLRPHLWKTHDDGKTWTDISANLPSGEAVNVVREDPRRPGLLYAGTERTVYVSFDDGGQWMSLRQNLPITSIRDLIVKDSDLAIATHGRGFWILDNIEPLRQLQRSSPLLAPTLFAPPTAIRMRWNNNTDTPPPPDEPAGQNPLEGAILDYGLPVAARAPVTLQIYDAAGALVRAFSSADRAPPIADTGNVPAYWIRPAQTLSAQSGLHRFAWDLRAAPPSGLTPVVSMSATPGDTPVGPRGPYVLPGSYVLVLTVDGQRRSSAGVTFTRGSMRTSSSSLRRQFELSRQLTAARSENAKALAEIVALRQRSPAAALLEQLDALDGAAPATVSAPAAAAPAPTTPPPAPAAPATTAAAPAATAPPPLPDLTTLGAQLGALYEQCQGADAAPTAALEAAAKKVLQQQRDRLTQWRALAASAPN